MGGIMQAAVLSVSVLCLLLLIYIVFRLNKSDNGSAENMQSEMRDRQDKIGRDIADSHSKLRQEINSNVSNSVTALGKLLLEPLKQFEERLKTFESANEQKLDAIRNTISKQLNYIQEDNNKKLDEIRVTVDEKLQKTLDEKISRSFKLVNEQLESVYKGLGEMQNLAAGVGDLKKVLSNVKTRGILGEIQLGAILKDILTPDQYDCEVTVKPDSRECVEYAIKLPAYDGAEYVYLPVDCKFPGDTYMALQDAYNTGDKELVKTAYKNLETSVKRSAKDIRDKYIAPPHTTNFAVMFLPFEGLYAEVVNHGLVETLQHDYNINIAGPSTMAALLNSLQMGFKTLQIQKRSSEVWQILGAVKTEFTKFEDVLASARNRIRLLDEDLDKLVGVRTRTINRKLSAIEKLDENETAGLLEE